MKTVITFLAALLTIGAAPAPFAVESYPYGSTELQVKVDRSFSAIPINAWFHRIRSRLTKVESGCKPLYICTFRDAEGIRYGFEGDGPRSMMVLTKSARTIDFGNRPISALGIGTARTKADVLVAIARFDSALQIDCNPRSLAGDIGHHGCRAETGPGWIEIGFDEDDQLSEARLYGYFV